MDPDLSHMDYRTRRLLNGALLVVFLGIVATVAVVALVSRPKGVSFTIVFKDARGLGLGAPVTLKGVKVGEVTRVEFMKHTNYVEVDVAIEPKQAAHVPDARWLSARIRRSWILPGNQQVALIIQRGAQGQIAEGARVAGVESLAGELVFLGTGRARDAYKKGMEKAGEKLDAARDWWQNRKSGDGEDSKAAARARKALGEWFERLETLGDKDSDDPKKEIAKLRRAAEDLRKEWKREGLTEEAAQMDKIIEALKEYEDALK